MNLFHSDCNIKGAEILSVWRTEKQKINSDFERRRRVLRLLQYNAVIMKRYFFVSIPKPLSFFITAALLILVTLAVGSYIAENPLPVGGGKANINITLEDVAEKLYGEMSR